MLGVCILLVIISSILLIVLGILAIAKGFDFADPPEKKQKIKNNKRDNYYDNIKL